MFKDDIALRPIEPKDAPYIMKWIKDPATTFLMADDLENLTPRELETFCANAGMITILKKPVNIHYAVVNAGDDEYLGTVSLKHIDYKAGHCEYSIVIMPGARGEGVGTKATKLILDKAFLELDLHRVYLKVLPHNTRAICFYERFGFIYEGELREHFWKAGRHMSIKYYSMLKGEYCPV